jgi:hypothetical protein
MRANRTPEMLTFDSYGVHFEGCRQWHWQGPRKPRDAASLSPHPHHKQRRIQNFVGLLFRPVFRSSDRRQYFERDGCAFVNNYTGRPIFIHRGTPRSSSRVWLATGHLRHWLKTKDRPRSSNVLHLHFFCIWTMRLVLITKGFISAVC